MADDARTLTAIPRPLSISPLYPPGMGLLLELEEDGGLEAP